MKRIVGPLLVALLLGSVRAGAQEIDVGGGGDTTAVVVNTKDGSSRFRIAFRILRTGSDVVDSGNAAVAFASCEGCQSVAISFQVVLVSSDPSVVTPENVAIAMNFMCTDCDTLASAYQWILGTDGQAHFTPEGSQTIAELRQRLAALLTSDLSIVEIQAELDRIASDLQRVLIEELEQAGPPDAEAEQVQDSASPTPDATDPADQGSPGAGTSPSPAGGEFPSPEATSSPTPENEISPTSEPSATPTSATPSPTVSSSP